MSCDEKLDPQRLAVLYYFGELGYWRMPKIAADALEQGYDGAALRRLAGLLHPVQDDMKPAEIDAAFREMGVAAPIPKVETQLILACEASARALSGEMDVSNAATHIRIYICELNEPPQELRRIVDLSAQGRSAPANEWPKLRRELRDAMAEFVSRRR
jgi:hypothetical protein